MTPRIIINAITFGFKKSSSPFNSLTTTFDNVKCGLVGENGIGKSSLLKLITGMLVPDSGSIQINGKLSYQPQSFTDFDDETTVADVLGVAKIMSAILRINHGSIDETDYELAHGNWDLIARTLGVLNTFALSERLLDKPFFQLSGGQKTKVLLAKTKIFPAEFYLFDEPTNNLDKQGRQAFYDFIDSTAKAMIIASHDRRLLNKMEKIVEISSQGLFHYGGNFDFYQKEKTKISSAVKSALYDAEKSIKKAKKSIQSSREKYDKRKAIGLKSRKTTSQAKLILDAKKSRAEITRSKMAITEEKLLSSKIYHLTQIRNKIEKAHDLNLSLDNTSLPKNKMIISIENLKFIYPNVKTSLFDCLNFNMLANHRVALCGPNGSGKSTMIKLIKKQLQPTRGTIRITSNHIAYFDQQTHFLDESKTLVENYLSHNPNCQEYDAYSALALYNFKNKVANQLFGELSGGEKIRAGLAICLISKHPPELIILDEPTNHLDLNTLKAIEVMLQSYQGAMIVISHDTTFLQNLGINRFVNLEDLNDKA
jgi:ATPase subunit of ABC transporter with duplicated ATPase domains